MRCTFTTRNTQVLAFCSTSSKEAGSMVPPLFNVASAVDLEDNDPAGTRMSRTKEPIPGRSGEHALHVCDARSQPGAKGRPHVGDVHLLSRHQRLQAALPNAEL